MAAIAAGSLVVAGGEPFIVEEAPPKFGVCESAVAGPPPTAVVVDFEDGTQTTYAVSDNIFGVLPPANPSILGSYVVPTTIPNPGGRLAGRVTNHVSVTDSSGGVQGDIVFVKTPIGFVLIPFQLVQVVPNA